MLSGLVINNFAIIDHLEINFENGLTVLTGETGAGKSIIVDALDFLLGSRVSTDVIKTGTNKAIVEGMFFVGASHDLPLQNWFEKNGFDLSEQIIISRELSNQGSKVRINGSLANVSHLLFLREHLIDIHEQSEHIDLLKIEKQLEILDSFGDSSHKRLIDDYKKTFEEYQTVKNKLNTYLESSSELNKKIDFLKYAVNEIRSATIKNPDEENILQEKREILLNKKELAENTNLIYEIINGDGQNNLLFNMSQIKKLLAKSNDYDKSFESYLESIEESISQIKDLSSFANDYLEDIDTSENTLEQIEERLELFYNLKKKYGKTLVEIQEYFQKIQKELNDAVEVIHELPLQEQSVKEKGKEINNLAEKLTRSREKIVQDFVNKINEELETLGFNGVGAYCSKPLLVVEFTVCDLCLTGKEQIQFLFSANPDEPPKPLLKVASGGELSRIVLAIKSTICRDIARNVSTTMLFDEIDVGVSGEIAASVAKKLYKISKQNQVICITHQPIICAMADSHFVIEKNTSDGTTQVSIKEVMSNNRTEALATLLTPEKKLKEGITEDAKQFAKSLLENAKKIKEKELIKLIKVN